LSAFSQASSIAPDVDIYRRNADRARAMIAYRNELLAQRDKIDARIHGYQEAIKRLGFGENVAEIEEWTALSKDAKKQFEEKSAALAADLIVSKFQDEAMHHAFHDLDPQRAKRLIALMDKHDPRPVPLMRLVAILGHMNAGDRDTIERAAKGLTAEIQGLIEHGDATWSKAEILKLAIDIGDGVFGTSYAKLWSVTDVSLASLYNNATRRMAMAEIDRITTLNQRQMSTLKYLHAKLVADVKERQRINGELQAR
jgi:hypothetical protein